MPRYSTARIQLVVNWRIRASNCEFVGQIRRRNGTSTNRIIGAQILKQKPVSHEKGRIAHTKVGSQAYYGENDFGEAEDVGDPIRGADDDAKDTRPRGAALAPSRSFAIDRPFAGRSRSDHRSKGDGSVARNAVASIRRKEMLTIVHRYLSRG
jgi:hypothetical protein